MKPVHVLFAAWLLPAPALAQEVDCASAMTQTDMNICAARAHAAADADLNETYRAAMDSLSAGRPEVAGALRDAQRKWIPYRDAACAAEGAVYEGGSIRPLIVSSCLERLTRVRTADIRAAYEMK
ncbi:lysozyme inhibitor LprI family protein [Celeribacter indicus]|uniref:Lysozyme inhibitor LprI-like N-terminal domain-containing protein n=1 Tax=Celeribacter indicus TaxID=1208324 RepID=A0A0B5DYP5_9RHOB|nr:lysozyme inhibitor LprI family protein [Celeribacter indicus]AJE48109.1 hypothetical protein P73_3394 [Celeribacter indicus]SDW32813.1 Uncharacterized conserved protein YecT, DUF1311 family [Celeribacter indicus]